MPGRRDKPENRFNRYVEKTESCWLWRGGKYTKSGYGCFRGPLNERYAHRCSWVINKGKIPEGISVLHKCDVRLCVNPDHLFLGTQADNAKDMANKGRSTRGEKNPMAKLTDGLVRRIRTAKGTHARVAMQFDMSLSATAAVRQKRSWKHVK